MGHGAVFVAEALGQRGAGVAVFHQSQQHALRARVGDVKYVIKHGIVYDAKQLLTDVEKIVAAAKK